MKGIKRKKNEMALKGTQCQICLKFINGNSYKFKSHLYGHSVVKSRFECSYCSKEYFRRDAFEKHITVHTGYRKYHICDHCDRGFVDKRNLVAHLRIHDDYFNMSPGRFKCMACGLCYCEERLLKYHIRKQHYNLHEKETTYEEKKPNDTWVERVMQSEICAEITKIDDNTIMIKKANTTRNIEINATLEKTRFQEYMTSVFANMDKSHYSKAVCNYCDKEMLKKSLIKHIREKHLKQKRFKCEVCNAHFHRHYQMMNHKCGSVRTRKRN